MVKYGHLLPSRSVPEWRAHNILYNDIRDTIVQETEGCRITADGYNRIFGALNDEYQNVNLFVKSKLGEIEQRLRTCQRLIGSIAGNPENDESTERETTVYQLQCEVAKVSRDIQHLSRFAGAQFTGFRKLVKKFRKLAPKDGPQLNDFERLMNGPDSFANIDFTTIFLELSLLYDMMRSGHYVSFKSVPNNPSSLTLDNQLCSFDVRMVSTPTQTEYYWVHSEDLMQVKVFLLQHLSLVPGSDQPQVTRTTFFDDSDFDLAIAGREPGQLRQVELLGPQSAVSEPVFCAPTGGMRYFCAAAVSQNIETKLAAGTLGAKDLDGLDNNAKFALGWALSRQIKPQATVTSSRLRYESVQPATSELDAQQVWAAIDSDVVVHNCNDPLARFPHHVLQIRYTGGQRPRWLEEVSKLYLVFKVSESFTLYRYALYLFQNVRVFRSPPSWARVLENGEDIRRAPKPVRHQKSKRSMRSLRSQRSGLSSRRPSQGSSAGDESGAATTSRRNILLNDTSLADSARYWNEFDNPEDDDEANVFSVFINDEDEELQRIMRAEALSEPLLKFSQSVRRLVRHVKQLLGLEHTTEGSEFPDSTSPYSSERESLLSGDHLNGAQYSPRLHAHHDEEAALPELELSQPHHRENLMMAMLTTMCLTLAAIIDVMVYAILLSEDVDDLVVGAQIVLVIGLLLSTILAALGAMAFGLHSSSSWFAQFGIHAFWFVIMCFGVGGIAWIVTN